MTYEELIDWVELNAERFSTFESLIAGIRGWDRLPNWVKDEIQDIWETFHDIQEEAEPLEEEEQDDLDSTYADDSIIGRIASFFRRIFGGD